MPYNPSYNSSVKNLFEGGMISVGGILGGLTGGYAGVAPGIADAKWAHDSIWADPGAWQGKKFGSAPFPVTGSAPMKSMMPRKIGSAPGRPSGIKRKTGSAPSRPTKKVSKPTTPPIKRPVVKPGRKTHKNGKYHRRQLQVGRYYKKRFS